MRLPIAALFAVLFVCAPACAQAANPAPSNPMPSNRAPSNAAPAKTPANGLDTAAIATDENGASAGSGTYAWTGTFVTGNTDNSTTRCLDWTSADGAQTGTRGWTSAGSSDWTSNGTAACTAALRLYCVETTPPG